MARDVVQEHMIVFQAAPFSLYVRWVYHEKALWQLETQVVSKLEAWTDLAYFWKCSWRGLQAVLWDFLGHRSLRILRELWIHFSEKCTYVYTWGVYTCVYAWGVYAHMSIREGCIHICVYVTCGPHPLPSPLRNPRLRTSGLFFSFSLKGYRDWQRMKKREWKTYAWVGKGDWESWSHPEQSR